MPRTALPTGWAQLCVAFTAQLTFAKELVRPLWYVCIKKCALIFLMVCESLIWGVVSRDISSKLEAAFRCRSKNIL